jgi:hypothetical protein
MVSAITLVTATLDFAYLGHFGQHNTDRIISILRHATQGGQGKYSGDCSVWLLPTILLINFANVNDI